ncbi:DUF732 domain-containing protein [Gordonia sp. MP11Mi]|uniref:DUF732 domain-containing protein n=1 Tax=Gordonia sp. MP11Mi TaxID=3022769 RepID=A0AA97GWM1_9ACTN
MRLRIVLVAPLVAGIALLSVACGSDSDTNSTRRQAYLSAVKLSGVTFADDDQAISVGRKICEDVKSGTSVSDAAKSVSQASNIGQGTAVVGAAIGSLCPGAASKMLPDSSDLPTMPSIDLPG